MTPDSIPPPPRGFEEKESKVPHTIKMDDYDVVNGGDDHGDCQPKKKKAKKNVFSIYFNYDGIFTSWPLKYAQGQMKEVNDVKTVEEGEYVSF
ncbi:hypothetical protein Tco_0268737 [Tanacetum coccineum]